MITAIIVDDESKGRTALRQKIRQYCPDVQVLAEAGNGQEAIQCISKYHPRLVFLDIEMPGMNGFEMLNSLPEKNFHVIFTTAYDQYAIKAIRYAAFDYLLKPVDVEELRLAVSRIAGLAPGTITKQVEVLQQSMGAPGRQMSKLAIPTLEGLLFIDISAIVYLEASSNYTHIHLAEGPKITASRTLKEFEEMLPADNFFRTHHSYIINLNYIRKYIKGDGGQIEMKTGSVIDVSRRKKDEFLRIIGN